MNYPIFAHSPLRLWVDVRCLPLQMTLRCHLHCASGTLSDRKSHCYASLQVSKIPRSQFFARHHRLVTNWACSQYLQAFSMIGTMPGKSRTLYVSVEMATWCDLSRTKRTNRNCALRKLVAVLSTHIGRIAGATRNQVHAAQFEP